MTAQATNPKNLNIEAAIVTQLRALSRGGDHKCFEPRMNRIDCCDRHLSCGVFYCAGPTAIFTQTPS